MSLELNQLPRGVFQAVYTANKATVWYITCNTSQTERKYLEVPVNKDVFEVPILTMNAFLDMVNRNNDSSIQAMAIELYSYEKDLRYVSVDRYMRDVLVDDYKRNKLLKCYAKSKEGNVKYYGTHGTVFNESFEPVAMCSWLMERTPYCQEDTGEMEYRYRFIRPIFRVSPTVYVNPQDTMQKFLAKKFVSILLSDYVITPNRNHLPQRILTSSSCDMMNPSVYIENSPFNVSAISEPTIDTTNEELRNTALEHIEEIIQ